MLTMRGILAFFAKKYEGDWEEIFQAIQRKEKVDKESVETFEEYLQANGVEYVSMIDDNYPECLKRSYMPPFALFYKSAEVDKLPDEVEKKGCGSIDYLRQVKGVDTNPYNILNSVSE